MHGIFAPSLKDEPLTPREFRRMRNGGACCPDCKGDLREGPYHSKYNEGNPVVPIENDEQFVDSPWWPSYREVYCMNGECGSEFRVYGGLGTYFTIRQTGRRPNGDNPKESEVFTEEERLGNSARAVAAREGHR